MGSDCFDTDDGGRCSVKIFNRLLGQNRQKNVILCIVIITKPCRRLRAIVG